MQSDNCKRATKPAEIRSYKHNVLTHIVRNPGCCLQGAYVHCMFEQPEEVRISSNTQRYSYGRRKDFLQ